MSDHDIDSPVSDPAAHWDMNAVHNAETVELHLLDSGFLPGREPVGTLLRSLYDREHCGSCNELMDPDVQEWKRVHIYESADYRRDFWNRTCRYERGEYLVDGDLACQPEDVPWFVAQQIHPQLQYPNVEFQTDTSMNRYLLNAQSQPQPGEANATPNFLEYAEEQQYQQPAPGANWINSPSPLAGTIAYTGQPDQLYNPQGWFDMCTSIPSHTGDSSTIPAPYNTFHQPDTQEWSPSYPLATSSQYQHEDTSNNRRGSASSQHSRRTDHRTGQ
ncbi:predicted protein [Sclerotinia sclerotiorum 1980 UF-70]|uniref:Uncharacterized protein n=2 Tax=Sclerotinia sclerotiorum (strain ATCC 18683 / 1980 / Ss-1) TaxID=665079 RepID=A7F7E9_SCLS1|nr:predicted protein [Sclerotinia sclerotiorum 1980 UF-70]APA15567.1 hypothetical protein sscle_15g103370 [Sclerotinia sclerotiorum 1980 UF-70]EDN98670.1 predicted protein [Sclerotinia sclerotiorum 1980 UF-70]